MILPYYLTPETCLPSEIDAEHADWSSTLQNSLNERGELLFPEGDGMSAEFQLTATTSLRNYTFTVRMLGKDCRWLAGYTRVPDQNYNAFVSKSLHLALIKEGCVFELLNSNYGVLFAAADYRRSVAGMTRLLQSPRIFRLAEQGFGVLAISLDHEGRVDRPGELLYFESKDLVHYEELRTVRLIEAELQDFSCELDAATRLYRIGWKEEGGQSRYTTTEDFIRFNPPETGEKFPVKLVYRDIVNEQPKAQAIALTESEASYLRNKLGRVRNISVNAPTIHVQTGTVSLDLKDVRVTAGYSDGSTSFKRITADSNEVAAIPLSTPGTYTLNAKVVRDHFPYPMMKVRPDPAVLRYKGRYYFISTDDDGQRKIYIRSADTLEGLEDGRTDEVLLWDGDIPDGERRGQHWAPELHVIDGKLYCLLAISVNDDWHGVQAHLVLLKGDDPMNPSHWDTPRRVLDHHGKVLADPNDRAHNVSLDMTYFEHNGKAYVVWSQPKWFGEEQERASLYIATIDPALPWQLTSDPVRICRNEYGWDRNGDVASGVAEGPFVLMRNDKIYMVYSGSNVGPHYAVGLLEMLAADDPLDPTAWRKFNYPVMHSLSLPGQYGPGHNMFVQDEYGDWYNVYHACGIEGGFRHGSIRPMHFRFDGTPILDMREEEELRPEFEQVNLTIIVR
jgi:GH43 family beta-xylosidase